MWATPDEDEAAAGKGIRLERGRIGEGTQAPVSAAAPTRARARVASGRAALTAERATFAYGAHRVLESVDLTVARGECVGIEGRNGAGKSTLLNLLGGALAPTSGRVVRAREATVLRMRFGLDDQQPRTLEEIGESLDLSRERVRQIETEALHKLAGALQGPNS